MYRAAIPGNKFGINRSGASKEGLVSHGLSGFAFLALRVKVFLFLFPCECTSSVSSSSLPLSKSDNMAKSTLSSIRLRRRDDMIKNLYSC